jgi:hypothetical protein
LLAAPSRPTIPNVETKALYHLTAAGREACAHTEWPAAPRHRAVLGAVHEATHFDEIRARLSHLPSAELLSCLEDLEAIGLIESVSVDWVCELYALGYCEPQPLPRRR